jgi:succinate dehydrogenase hydrophobic anchor subunit
MTLWIARLWFAAATVLFAVAAVYPMPFLRVLNYDHDHQQLSDPRTVWFFQLVAKFATMGGILGFIESWIR